MVGAGPAPDRQVDVAALADGLKKGGCFLRAGDLLVVDRQHQITAAQAHLRKNAVRFECGDPKSHLAIEKAGRHDVDSVQDRGGIRRAGFDVRALTSMSTSTPLHRFD